MGAAVGGGRRERGRTAVGGGHRRGAPADTATVS